MRWLVVLRRGSAAGAWWALVALSTTASAQGAKGEVVVTGTRTPESSQRATVKVDVVGRDEIEKRGAVTVADALQMQPGVRVGAGEYGYLGGTSALQMQGFDRDRVLVLEDGERVIGDVGGAIDLGSLSVAELSRIELVTGPQSALYGASAVGGVVNLLSGPPDRLGLSGRARLEGRSRRGLVAQLWGATRHDDESWLRLDAAATRQDGVRAGAASLVPDTARQQLGLRIGGRVNERWAVRARARWMREQADSDERQVIPGQGDFRLDTADQGQRFAAQMIGEGALGAGRLRLSAASQLYQGQRRQGYAGSAAGTLRTRDQTLQSVEPTLTLADGPRTWVLGARAEVERIEQGLTRSEASAGGIRETRLDEVPEAQRSSGAVYGQIAWKLGERWTVLPGVRHEAHSRYGQATAPRLSAAFRPAAGLTLRASAGRGYRAPSAKELGFAFDHSSYGYKVEGNSALAPETSWGASTDVALRSGWSSARLGLFANRVERMIDIDLASPVSVSSGVSTYTYRNRGEALTAGGFAGVRVSSGERHSLDLSYDHLWTRDRLTGAPLPGRPAHALAAALQASPGGRLSLTAKARWFSGSYVSESLSSPGYTLLDLRVARALWGGAEAYLGATNALDQRQTPGRQGDLRPPVGRALYLGLRADFPAEEDP